MQLARKMREKHRSNGRFSLSERHESIRRPILRQMDEFDALVDLVKSLKIVVLGNTGTGTRILAYFVDFLLFFTLVRRVHFWLFFVHFVAKMVFRGFFFIDIIIIFNTALTTEDFETIDDHKQIAIHYLKGWFWIDLIAIFPF